ncbi:MAG: FAD-dependent oxidoreductase [Fimbriimonas sp.]
MRVAVVGAGIVGLNAAWQLVQQGHAVTLFDQFSPGHTRGSSHGRSRIVRKAYPDPMFTGFMVEGYALWSELESALGRTLIHPVGLLYFGPSDSENLRSMADGLAAHDEPFEVLDPVQSTRVFPDLKLHAGEVGIWTADAGWVEADQTMAGLLLLCRSSGVSFRFGAQCHFDDLNGFDRWVVCAGSWITQWVPIPVKVTLQTTAYVRHQQGGPVWVEDSADLCYGFPSEEAGFKIGVHRPGPSADSEEPDEAALNAIRQTASDRFGVSQPDLTEITRCRYTNSPDEDFIWGEVPGSEGKGIFVSACSGHAFKFGPWIGRRVLQFVEEKEHMSDYPRFFWQESR